MAIINPPPRPGLAGRNFISLPINGVSVSDAIYGAIDDCLGGYFFATWTTGSAALSLYTDIQAVTVANTGPGGVALVTFPNTLAGSPASPGPDWIGKPIAINGAGTAGGTLVALVANGYYNNAGTPSNVWTLVLDRAAPTTLSSSSQQVACPCFLNGTEGTGLSSCVNQAIWIATAGVITGGTNGLGGGAGAPHYAQPFASTIASYTSPFAVTMALVISGAHRSASAQAAVHVEWGTDNTATVITAGLAALQRGSEVLFFPGKTRPYSTGRFGIFNFAPYSSIETAQQVINSSVLAAVHWRTSDASVFLASGQAGNGNYSGWTDEHDYKSAIPWQAGAPPPPKVTIDARQHLPRCEQASYIVVEIIGDSWSGKDPSGEGNAVWGPFAQNLQKQNPGKKIYYVSQGATGTTWHQLLSVIGTYATVTVDGLGTVTPDLVCLFVTGGNDGSFIRRNDIAACINTVRGWTTRNGLPPDVMMLTGCYPRTQENFSLATTAQIVNHEYSSVLQRSLARTQGYGFVDIAARGAYALRGWCEDYLTMRLVPSTWPNAVAGATNPYVVPVQCRDFFLALALGTTSTSGTTFWGSSNTVSIALSAKPDNRLVIGTEAGTGNLTVTAVTWGMTVATTTSITNGAAVLTTSGQSTLTSPANVLPAAPDYGIGNAGAPYLAAQVGQCFFATGVYYGDSDFRSYIIGCVSTAGVAVCDANGTSGSPATHLVGGQMFIPTDATAAVDCIVAGAGATTHPLTGANSLVTKVSAYSSRTSVTLAANASATLTAQSVNVFVGSISVGPSYNTAVSVTPDAGNQPCLIVRVTGSHVKVSYVMGGFSPTINTRAVIQTNELMVWEGEVERWGGPFFPKIYTATGQTAQPALLMVDDRDADLRLPSMTERHGFGTGGAFNFIYAGDTGHPGQAFLNHTIDEASATQRLSTGLTFDNTFGTNTPLTGFSYTIPANQAFTTLTPAGTLATGTVTLPSVFPQGGMLQVFSTQTVTALTVSAPTGFTISGTAATTISANGTIAYRLQGTVFYRVQ